MASNQANIRAVITADDKASGVLKGFSDHVQGIGGKLADVAKIAAIGITAATGAAVAFGVAAVKAYSEAEQTIEQTNAVLKSTGKAAGVTAAQVTELATNLQKVTKFSDEEIRSGENLLLTFTKIGKDIFPQATETILNMSTALGQDLKSSAVQLGKALQDPVLGITALRRVGVNFSDAQKDVIQKLVDTGKTAEAQKLILKELEVEFGGSARAAGTTFAGKLAILKNSLNDVQEQIGFVIVDALQPFAVKLADVVAKIDWEKVVDSTVMALKAFWQELMNLREPIMNIYHAVADYLQPKLVALFNTIKDDVIPVLVRLWREVIEPMLPVVGTLLVAALGYAIDAFNLLLKVATPVVTFFLDNKEFLLPIIGAFIALKTAMAFNAAFDAFTVGFNTIKLITIPSTIASLGTLQATLVGFTGWGIFAGVAIASFTKIMSAIDQLKGELDAANDALNKSTQYQDDFYRSLRRARDEGRITQEEFLRRNKAYGQSSQLPGFASGTDFSGGGWSWVGEQGAEKLYLPRGTKVVPHGRSMQSGAVSNVTIAPQIGVYTGTPMERRKLALQILDDLRDLANQQNTTVSNLLGGNRVVPIV